MQAAEQCSRYAAMAATAAKQQIAALKRASSAVVDDGDVPLLLAVNIAEMMLQPAPVAPNRAALIREDMLAIAKLFPPRTRPRESFTFRAVDLRGHHRPVYNALLKDVLCQARARLALWDDVEVVHALQAGGASENDARRPDLMLWRSKLSVTWGGNDPLMWPLTASFVESVLSRPGDGGSLHAMTADDSLDAWTFRELVGLHALAAIVTACCAIGTRRQSKAWTRRLREIAMYHFENTQPDNVTTQPWGFPAFAMFPETSMHADQQLHDIASNPASNEQCDIVTALLLADASATLRAAAALG